MVPSGALLVAVGLLSLVCGSPALEFEEWMVAQSSGPVNSMPEGLDNGRSRVKRQAVEMTQPLRIMPFYADDFDSNLQEKASFVRNDIIPNLINFVKNSLRVAPLPGPILLSRNCTTLERLRSPLDGRYACVTQCQQPTMCGFFQVPTEHLRGCGQCNAESSATLNLSTCAQESMDGPGITDHDLVLYIMADQSVCPGDRETAQTIAFAIACEQEFLQDRPIAGYINFCPVGLRIAGRDKALAVAKHEVMHVLGISRQLYSFWRDPTNNMPRTLRNDINVPMALPDGNFDLSSSTVDTVTYENWITAAGPVSHNVSRLITPAIRNEAMTAIVTFNPVFSRFTFAALEDSGWYNVNYSNAEELIWGRNAGCRFAEGSCGEWIRTQTSSNQSLSPFCDTESLGMVSCSVDREAISVCNNYSYSSIPPEYQYFSDPQIGGLITVADFCPFQEGMKPCYNRSLLPNENSLLQDTGPGSRCINHGRPWTVNGSQLQALSGGGCYQFFCDEDAVTITIASQDIVCACSQDGQEMMVDLVVNNQRYQGSILCPSCTQICHTPSRNIPKSEITTQPGITPLSASQNIYGNVMIILLLSLLIKLNF